MTQSGSSHRAHLKTTTAQSTGAEVIDIGSYRERHSTQTTAAVVPAAASVSPEDLIEEPRPELGVAMRLLGDALRFLDDAVRAMSAGDVVHADDRVMHLYLLLPEMFCCRALGDGFSATVVAVHFGIKASAGNPLSLEMLRSIQNAMLRIRLHPFADLGDVLDYIMAMEDAGLVVDAPSLGEIAVAHDG